MNFLLKDDRKVIEPRIKRLTQYWIDNKKVW